MLARIIPTAKPPAASRRKSYSWNGCTLSSNSNWPRCHSITRRHFPNSSLQGVRQWAARPFPTPGRSSACPNSPSVIMTLVSRLASSFPTPSGEGNSLRRPSHVHGSRREHRLRCHRTQDLLGDRGTETEGRERVERHSCDLFDYRVYYESMSTNSGESSWSERRREIIPDTGLVAQWLEFNRDPTPFFV